MTVLNIGQVQNIELLSAFDIFHHGLRTHKPQTIVATTYFYVFILSSYTSLCTRPDFRNGDLTSAFIILQLCKDEVE